MGLGLEARAGVGCLLEGMAFLPPAGKILHGWG